VSVVVPTRNRAHLLPRLAGALERQAGAPAFEVVVVDDCSDDATAAVLADLAERSGGLLRALRTDQPGGAGAARNVGWRAARGRFVAFTDDDCVPEPGWLAGLAAGLREADVVQGRVEYDPEENARRGPFGGFVWIDELSWQFETCNIGYRRDLLQRLGGFDESFEGDAFGEDIDLGWRAVEQAAVCRFEPDALVIHDIKRTNHLDDFLGAVRNTRRWRHIGRVVRAHPGYARRRLHHGIFLRRTHLPTLVALAGLAAGAAGGARPRWLAVAAAAFVPWLAVRTTIEVRPGRRRNWPVVLPLAFVVDAGEVGVTVASAIRNRARVL